MILLKIMQKPVVKIGKSILSLCSVKKDLNRYSSWLDNKGTVLFMDYFVIYFNNDISGFILLEQNLYIADRIKSLLLILKKE